MKKMILALSVMLFSGSSASAQGVRDLDTVDHETILKSELPASFPLDESGQQPGEEGYRIVGGYLARPGQWPSMVALYRRSHSEGRSSFCGGSLIDGEWVLTAAHCVVMRDQAGNIGPRNADDFFVRAGTLDLGSGGHFINVTQVVVHPDYAKAPKINDIALLRLATAARVPRQQLAERASQGSLVRDGVVATVIGFGLVRPQPVVRPPDYRPGPASSMLLQAEVPIVSREKCGERYPDVSTEATFCAGFDEGGKDTCQGDSGGPVFAKDQVGQLYQIGVVSRGAGCAQPRAWGVYTNVPHFEEWIRRHAPGVAFGGTAKPKPPQVAQADQALQSIGSGPAKPVKSAQVTVDIPQGVRLKVGQVFTVRVTSSAGGNLVVFNREESGKTYMLFPNRFTKTPRQIKAGSTVQIPAPQDGFALRTTPPTGRNLIIAFVVPAGVRMEDLTGPYEGLAALPDPAATLEKIAARSRGVEVIERAPPDRAVGTRAFQIVDK